MALAVAVAGLLGLGALLGADSGVCAGRIHEGYDRQPQVIG